MPIVGICPAANPAGFLPAFLSLAVPSKTLKNLSLTENSGTICSFGMDARLAATLRPQAGNTCNDGHVFLENLEHRP
jgi:hypothetical protein